MRLAIEQAGSVFTGWIASCLSCLRPEGDIQGSHHQKAMKSNGVEREMRICHSQPHLVPPMKLVVYDDLPSPGPPPRTSSFPSWITEGRSIASRASNRASMSFKRQSTTPLRISAPTDFRRVETFQSFASSPAEFQPLVLKIHTPGNRLSDLPTFDEFLPHEDRRRSLAWPAKAVVSPTDPSRISRTRSHHHSSSSFQLACKPVGSGSRRSSLANLEQLLDSQSPITSPGIPHFSARTSTATGLSEALFSPTHSRLESSAGYGSMPQRQRSDIISSIAVPPRHLPKLPCRTGRYHLFLPTTPHRQREQLHPIPHPPPSPRTTSQPQPQTPPQPAPAASRNGSSKQATKPLPLSPGNPEPKRAGAEAQAQAQTPSASAHAPSAAQRPTPPSRGTQDRNPALPSEKDLEAFPSRALFSHTPPALSSTTMSIPDDRPYPTIYEGQQQQFAYSELEYYSSPNHRQSTIGLAF
ncbi:uncharacterized protein P174DRAFT_509201 [Aspergillus novofumigatus IBT 16806]|uniref:Uncharacterized protein n=1 Tax=Aspergillus novofumigatus (strain IBT 16806) TaxID=1392255 RepID=A0A2I1CNG8_ASPN1|nr:uncharacterized protein P174DRAFT_509201 [Aspergillus novofumigatus IBT 16806]PKX99159.1 hypothetical protein P174DRAFT_509201 [Aspergillus novofumigatus IBT 16806]